MVGLVGHIHRFRFYRTVAYKYAHYTMACTCFRSLLPTQVCGLQPTSVEPEPDTLLRLLLTRAVTMAFVLAQPVAQHNAVGVAVQAAILCQEVLMLAAAVP